MPERALRIGTRGSRLALWQAERVAALLATYHPGLRTTIVPIQSHGDLHGTSITDLNRVGIFTREIELAVLAGDVDLGVHSLKDLPTLGHDALVLPALLQRDDPRDVLVAPCLATQPPHNGRGALAALPHRARIATSSLRRRAELLRARPDLVVVELRGNVPTRVDKVERGEVDGVVLAMAGLTRLGLTPAGRVPLEPDVMLPAPAQGTIVVQARADDLEACELLAPLDDVPTRICTTAERLLLQAMEGGCRVPLGALAQLEAGVVTLRARIASPDGVTMLEETASGPTHALAALADRMATAFRNRGASALLSTLRDDV